MPPVTTITNEFITYSIADGVLFATFHKAVVIDLGAAHKILSSRLEMTGEKEYPALVDSSGVKSFTKEARDYLSSDAGRIGVKATAIIAAGYMGSTIANFFLKVTIGKPIVPTKLFSDRKKALAWLEKFR